MNNQTDLNIRKDDESLRLFESLVKNSLQKKDYQKQISLFMDIVKRELFTSSVLKKIKKNCRTRKSKIPNDKCIKSKSKKLQYKNYNYNDIITNTRMSIIEL